MISLIVLTILLLAVVIGDIAYYDQKTKIEINRAFRAMGLDELYQLEDL